jgi:hypothetical protein
VKETSITSSDVDTPTSAQVSPPSVDRASAPPGPIANATDGDSARIRSKDAARRLPTGCQVAPASVENTVVPASPAATACVDEVKATAMIFWVAGVTDDQVAPPSAVRSRVGVPVVTRHVSAVAQRMFCSPVTPGLDLGVQVRPPSVVPRTIPKVPTA